jgi:competence ComEA-like helix-hairpin-helix protein
MRIAFVSDIHANLQAWRAVHADIAAQEADRIICLGDIVGYGPSPAEVLTEVYSEVNHFVLGNHDAVVAGSLQAKGFNPYARELIRLTCEKLGGRARQFFRGVPLTIRNRSFACSHGSPAGPQRFGYVFKRAQAEAAWARSSHRLHFIGHTHRPVLYELSSQGRYRKIRPHSGAFDLEPDARYIVNCGSVGLSRDGDFRASYVVYDSSNDSLHWHRVAYDLEAFVAQVRGTYSNAELVEFLLGRVRAERRRPIRELIDFAPGRSELSEEVEKERHIEQVRASITRWKLLSTAACCLLLMGAAGFYGFWRSLPVPRTLAGAQGGTIHARPAGRPVTVGCLPAREPASDQLPAGWTVRLGDSRSQSVHLLHGAVELRSGTERQSVEVAVPPIELTRVRKVRFSIDGRRSKDFRGEVPALVVDYLGEGGQILRRGAQHEPLVVEGTALSKQHTLPALPEGVKALRLRLVGRFVGRVRLNRLEVAAYPDEESRLRAHGPLEVNSATAEELEKLPGIGRVTAERIVQFRTQNGPFGSVGDLGRVKGIGPKTLAEIRPYVRAGR